METKALMDANTAYCERHKVFQMFEGLMSRLVIERPDDPIGFLIGELQADRKPRVILGSFDTEVLAAQAEALRSAKGLVIVDANQVLSTIVASSVGDEAKAHLDKGEPIPDLLLVQALTQRLLSDECAQRGWVLLNFPQTLEQAQHLLAMGNLPTLVVHLDVPLEQTLARVTLRRYDPDDPTGAVAFHLERNPPSDPAVLARLKQRPEDSEGAVRAQVAAYEAAQRHVAPLLASLAFRVDASGDKLDVAARVARLLSAPPPSRAPRPAPAIALVGPPGSAAPALAARLCARFGTIAVSAHELLEEAVARRTPTGLKAKGYLESGAPAPDELICALVVDRLARDDCRRHGWVLEGFPTSAPQAAHLSERGVTVRDFLVVELPDEASLAELTGRRVDPENGKLYHLARMPPAVPAAVLARLAQHPRDTPDVARRRLAAWNAGKPGVVAHFSGLGCAHSFDGSMSADELFERLCPFVLRMDERHLVQ